MPWEGLPMPSATHSVEPPESSPAPAIAKKTTRSIVLVVHGQLFRDGIQRVLQGPERVIVGSCETLGQLDGLLETLAPPDLFVVGIDDSDHTAEAFSYIRRLRLRIPASKWIFLGRRVDRGFVREAVDTGADGLLLEDSPGQVLQLLAELVFLGHSFIPAALARILGEGPPRATPVPIPGVEALGAVDPPLPGAVPARGMIAPPHVETEPAPAASPPSPTHSPDTRDDAGPGRRPAVLSDRESEILQCLVYGQSNKTIARELRIAEATVKVHVKGLLRKMQVSNRTQAAIHALKFRNGSDRNDVGGGDAPWVDRVSDTTVSRRTQADGHAKGVEGLGSIKD